ncbi:MAG: hypothetical protein QM765_37215 [Myxococcales bacterium]
MTLVTYLLLALVVASALWAVLSPTLIRGAIALALTSALITILMFQMDAALAGVFELSVCAGLITVVFVSAISLTRPKGEAQTQERADQRRQAFLPVVGVVLGLGALLWAAGFVLTPNQVAPASTGAAVVGVREALWNVRRLDLLGQLLVIFVGVFGVVILFKEERKKTSLELAREQAIATIRAATGIQASPAKDAETKKEAA